MDLNIFGDDGEGDITSVIQNTDIEKFQKITNTLCAKRKSFEENLEQAGTQAKDEDRLELRDLIEEMRTFGIGEIEYAKWLVREVKAKN